MCRLHRNSPYSSSDVAWVRGRQEVAGRKPEGPFHVTCEMIRPCYVLLFNHLVREVTSTRATQGIQLSGPGCKSVYRDLDRRGRRFGARISWLRSSQIFVSHPIINQSRVGGNSGACLLSASWKVVSLRMVPLSRLRICRGKACTIVVPF